MIRNYKVNEPMKTNVPSNTFYSVYSFDTKEESCQSEDGFQLHLFLRC